MTSDTPILEVVHLKVEITEQTTSYLAVDDLSFAIIKGETVALVGESGAGKSMAAYSIMGLVPPSAHVQSGEIIYQNQNLLKLTEGKLCQLRGNSLSMVFQDSATALNPVVPVGKQIAEVIRLHRGLPRSTAKEQVLALMEMVGIPDPRRRYRSYSHQLSGGMRQRILLAMALACHPELLIADEPTTAVDPTVQAQIMDLMSRLIRDLKMSVLLITHDLDMVDVLADRVLVLHAGRLLEEGSVRDLFENPLHPYTKELLAARLSRITEPAPTRLIGTGAVSKHRSMESQCAFAGPCPLTHEKCRMQKPPMVDLGGRHVRCFALESHDK